MENGKALLEWFERAYSELPEKNKEDVRRRILSIKPATEISKGEKKSSPPGKRGDTMPLNEGAQPIPEIQTPPEEGQEEQTQEKSQEDSIIELGSITHKKGAHCIHCLTIIGQIEGHYCLPPQNKTTKYEHVIPQLVAIEQDPDIEGLVIILNTVGGDVEAGLAIAELISGMKKPTVSLVLGGGHSIGVPLAVSSNYSFIAPSATMTIHPVRMNGLVLGVPETLRYFDRMQERISTFVCNNSGISKERLHDLMMNTGELVMDVGSTLDGETAVKEGLIDSLGGLSDVVEKLYELIEERAAEKLGKDGKK